MRRSDEVAQHPKPSQRLALVPGHDELIPIPTTRGDCINVPKPCPFHGCRWNVFHKADRDTGIQWERMIAQRGPDVATCTLDVADQGGATLAEVGVVLGITRERIRQLETKALRKLHHARDLLGL